MIKIDYTVTIYAGRNLVYIAEITSETKLSALILVTEDFCIQKDPNNVEDKPKGQFSQMERILMYVSNY